MAVLYFCCSAVRVGEFEVASAGNAKQESETATPTIRRADFRADKMFFIIARRSTRVFNSWCRDTPLRAFLQLTIVDSAHNHWRCCPAAYYLTPARRRYG